MKVIFSDTHSFERAVFDSLNEKFGFQIGYLDFRLTSQTAQGLDAAEVVCSFVNDKLDRACLGVLQSKGVRLIALRSAGFNHVDLQAASDLGLAVCRVPGYSPYAVAEFALALLLTLNRKTHKAYNRVRDLNFSLDGLVGFDLHGKTVGVVGSGKIGKIFAKLVLGFGCRVLIFDLQKDAELAALEGVEYVSLDQLCRESDVISLHVPLNKGTFHLINEDALQKMKPNVLLINTGRGGLIETKALIRSLKKKTIGGAALDVYEEEENVFFHDLSATGLEDDTLARLLTFPNVVITSHQAFLTNEALGNIAQTTLENIKNFALTGQVSAEHRVALGS